MSHFSGLLRKELKRFMAMDWTGPFILVPVLFIVSLLIESWLQESGVIPYIQVGKRGSYSIWRTVMLTGLVATPVSTLFMGTAWKAGITPGRFRETYSAVLLSCFIITAVVMLLASFAVLPPLGVSLSLIAGSVFLRASVTALWVVSAASLCSSISPGHGGGVLSLGLFSLGLFPGLSGSSMNWWFAAPLGEMVTSSGPGATLAVMGHSLFYLLFSSFVLGRVTR